MSLVVTGTIGIDTIVTPSGHADKILGGSGTYFAAAASLYGGVRLVAAVGDDFPPHHRAVLEHFKAVDLTGLETRKGSKTFAWGGKYLAKDVHDIGGATVILKVLLDGDVMVDAGPAPVRFMATVDGIGNGLGYSGVLISVSFIRELLGSGKLLGVSVLTLTPEGGWYTSNGLMLLAPGAFFLIGSIIWALRTWKPELQETD
jgi:hypothetical protein